MLFFILAAAALLSAVILWYNQASGDAEAPSPPPEEDDGQRLRRLLAEDACIVEALAEAVRSLEAVMAHPEIGGPGFLLIQFLPADGCAVVTAQYPNIREALYRRIVRQELDHDELTAAGMPEALLSQGPSFETESGGVVMVSVQVKGVPPEFMEALLTRRERNTALGILAETLGTELPQFSVRIFGSDLLLSPEREVISTDG